MSTVSGSNSALPAPAPPLAVASLVNSLKVNSSTLK
jgi:hypothetical protein